MFALAEGWKCRACGIALPPLAFKARFGCRSDLGVNTEAAAAPSQTIPLCTFLQAIVDTVEALLPRYVSGASQQQQGVLSQLANTLTGGGSSH